MDFQNKLKVNIKNKIFMSRINIIENKYNIKIYDDKRAPVYQSAYNHFDI